MRVDHLIFVALICAATALLTIGLTNMVMFKNTAEARAQRDVGRRRLNVACILLVMSAGVGTLVGSSFGAVLVLVVASSACLIGRTSPTWMPPLALLVQVPMLLASAVFVLTA